MAEMKSAPVPKIIRVSKDDGSESPEDFYRALRLLRDAYPGFSSDREIIETLESGATLQTMFAFYKVDSDVR